MKSLTSDEPEECIDCENPKMTRLQSTAAKFTKRHLVALLVCMGSMNMFILRSNLTIAIIDMTSNKTVLLGNRTIVQGPEFAWDSKIRGFVLSLFYYGYLATPFGGYIASKYGGVNTYGYGILVTAILTITTPLNLRLNFYWFVFCRVTEGVAEAISYTSIVDIGSKWARLEERSKFVAFGFTGIYVGTTVSFPLCGYLAHHFDWTAIFYGTGTVAILWTIIWFLVVPNEPPDDLDPNAMSVVNQKDGKQSKIVKNAFIKEEKVSYPWKQILTSKTIWALSVGRVAYAWGYNIVVLCLPLYLKDVTTESTSSIGLLSAAPNFISIFAVPLFGCLVDYLINAKICTATTVHKTYLCGSLSLAAIILVSISFMSNLTAIIISLVFFKMLLSFAFIVSQVMPLCIAPAYSSLICGIAALWHTLAMIVSPVYIGLVVTNRTAAQWGICFISTAVVMAIGAAVFFLFASSEPQPWAVAGEQENKNRIDDTEMTSVTEKFLHPQNER